MSLRQLVTGSDMCTASDGAGPSNAVGALVDQLLGGASKAQEQLRDLPVHQGPAAPGHVSLDPSAAAAAAAAGASLQLPGLPRTGDMAHLEAFFPAGPAAAPSRPHVEDLVGEFERMRMQQGPAGPSAAPMPGMAAAAAAPPPHVSHNLKVFLDTARLGGASMGVPPPPAVAGNLSVPDACRIRDRSTILARQLYAEQGPQLADQQVAQLLESLAINPAALPSSLNHVHDASWHEVWAAGPRLRGPSVAAELAAAAAPPNWDTLWQQQRQQQHAKTRLPHPPSTGWADEFALQQQQQAAGPSTSAAPGSWAEEFAAGPSEGQTWAEELGAQLEGQTPEAKLAGEEAARAQSARLVAALTADGDPKMKSSKFLHFLSKMSRGELSFQDNKVVERPAADMWAGEFAQEASTAAPGGWAEEFATQRQSPQGAVPAEGPAVLGRDWADAFASGLADGVEIGDDEESRRMMEEAWAALGQGAADGSNPWVTEFAGGAALDAGTEAEWDELYRRHADLVGGLSSSSSGRHEYVFAENNPFLGDAAAMEKGKDLFKRGLLTEAALALEAEVRAHPANAEAWRLLGTVHAENDDDKQAIAAMDKALGAGPENLEVLLSLGVSHTNELDAGEALMHLSRWLAHHPQHSSAAAAAGPPPDSSQALSHSVRMFEAALSSSPADPDLHMALGVLHHLGRNYNEAIRAFQKALELRPQDYSLWNKLGATLANYSHSADAISAYRRALDLKPNYMRAWTNMGISYANIGDYTTSAAYYTRALSLNPGAEHVWGYLRTSLACAGRGDLMPALEAHDVKSLQDALPI